MIDPNTIEQALDAALRPQLLDSPARLLEAAESWTDHPVLGIDTEFLRERTYRAELGLVQVSCGRAAWLIDTINLADLEPLKHLLTDDSILKVLHSASEDLEVLWHTLGVVPRPMVDTQIACAMLGQPLQMSYHHAVKWLAGIEVDKEQTRSNWIRRPLRPEQLHYAATDVVFLPAMLDILRPELQQLGRWSWVEEDVAKMLDASQQAADPERAYLRLAGSASLDAESLHVLRALAAWREQQAVAKNLARGFVTSDAVLLQLAVAKPSTAAQLAEIRDVQPRDRQRHQDTWLQIIAESRGRQEQIEQAVPLDKQQRRQVDALRQLVQREARNLGIDPALLASRKQLEARLARSRHHRRAVAGLAQRIIGLARPAGKAPGDRCMDIVRHAAQRAANLQLALSCGKMIGAADPSTGWSGTDPGIFILCTARPGSSADRASAS
jgi:ribonuclease D